MVLVSSNVGTDFFTMFLMLDIKTTGSGNARKLLEHYHANMSAAIPGFGDEYTVQHMVDDMAIFYLAFMGLGMPMNKMALDATHAGLIPKDKADFTWNILFPTICTRFVNIVHDFDFAGIVRSILDGSYDRWPGAGAPAFK